jgi:hypothetical protein
VIPHHDSNAFARDRDPAHGSIAAWPDLSQFDSETMVSSRAGEKMDRMQTQTGSATQDQLENARHHSGI